MPDVDYDAFVSYRRSDGSRAAHWIRRELQAFRLPKALRHRLDRKLKIYLDTAYERGTSDFYDQSIRPALLASRHLIVIATPDAMLRKAGAEDWIAREVADFTAGPNGTNVMVVRAAGAFDDPLPADLAARFPNIEIVDLRNVGRLWFLNPLRAARISREVSKLIAPLAGLAPNEMPLLRQEEERRQQARLGSAAGIVSAVLITVSALSVYALNSRFRAQKALEDSLFSTARTIRLVQSTLDRGGEQAELRKSLLNQSCDLYDKLRVESDAEPEYSEQHYCRLERALESYVHEPKAEADRAFAAVLSEAEAQYHKSGQPADGLWASGARRALAADLAQRADFTGAEALVRSAIEQTRQLLTRHANHADTLASLAQTQFQLASIYEQTERRKDQALTLAEAATTADMALQHQNEDEPRRSLIEARARWRVHAAIMLQTAGDEPAAIELFKIAAEQLDEVVRLLTRPDEKPRRAEAQFNLALSQSALSAMWSDKRDFAKAKDARAKAMAQLDALDADKKAPAGWRDKAAELRKAILDMEIPR